MTFVINDDWKQPTLTKYRRRSRERQARGEGWKREDRNSADGYWSSQPPTKKDERARRYHSELLAWR